MIPGLNVMVQEISTLIDGKDHDGTKQLNKNGETEIFLGFDAEWPSALDGTKQNCSYIFHLFIYLMCVSMKQNLWIIFQRVSTNFFTIFFFFFQGRLQECL